MIAHGPLNAECISCGKQQHIEFCYCIDAKYTCIFCGGRVAPIVTEQASNDLNRTVERILKTIAEIFSQGKA